MLSEIILENKHSKLARYVNNTTQNYFGQLLKMSP